jgi:hypothetical protein
MKRAIYNQSNDNGMQHINFTLHQYMIVGGTLFPHETIHKGTLRTAYGTTVNHTDHVLTDQQRYMNLLDIRSFRITTPDL